VLVAVECRGGWLGFGKKAGGDKGAPRDALVLGVFKKDEAARFVSLHAQRERIREETRVLQRLLHEKQTELGTFRETLEAQYGVKPGNAFQLNVAERTLHLVSLPEGTNAVADAVTTAAANDVSAVQRTLHLEMDDDQVQHLLRVSAARSVTTDQIRALNFLLREKVMELKKANALLKERFGIESWLSYKYDADTRTLYLLDPGEKKPGVE